jgi:hypothetical protein
MLDNPSTKIQYVLLDRLGQVDLARVHVSHSLRPHLRMGHRKVDDVALADVARDHQGRQDGQVDACICDICIT